ncbi:uncharacterized protein LOC134233243 isoform X2 [Saccostrea cucullata]|uniref:uncharacterized protein LOC134233243 isoform X2 n=1 Tax=Saccostrea cuccullata TaxID=36930 RepID=UPI002ECFF15E
MECVCFKRPLKPRTISSTQCDKTCPNYTDEFSFAQCGGRNAYTIYNSGGGAEQNPVCYAIECGTRVEFSISQDCSELKFGVCMERDTQTRQGWIESMNLCKSLLPPSYLVGNLKIHDAKAACEQLNRTHNGSSWIGVANEVYVGYDRDPPLTVILLSVLVLIILGCLVLATTCWKIKTKERKNANKRKIDSPQEERYQDIDDEKLVNATNNINKTENYEGTYTETINGTYDHLRSKDARKKESENDYDHVESSKEEQYEGCSIKGNNQLTEADYDHACLSSDYGKCVITADLMDDEYTEALFPVGGLS